MAETTLALAAGTDRADPRWQDLYRIGAIAYLVSAVALVAAIAIYFIWGFKPGYASVADIFALLQSNRMAGLMSIEISTTLLLPITILPALALYAALKPVNESYALIALVLNLMGIVLFLQARPVVEMSTLSGQYAAATSDLAKSQVLAAGEAFNALFNGTGWLWANVFMALSGIINSMLMFRTRIFSRVIAYLGLLSGITGLGIMLPLVGPLFGLIGTFAGLPWFVLLALAFYRLGWGKAPVAKAAS